jgi:hypothetical protein
LSDQAPILLTTGTLTPQCIPPFKFELGWLHCYGSSDIVKNIWENRLNPI